MEQLWTALSRAPPSQWCQTFFLLSAGFIVAIQALPQHVRAALMNYGARRPGEESSSSSKTPPQTGGQAQRRTATATAAVWAAVTRLTDFGQVPHSWFLHFYVLSLSLSVFWAWQFVRQGGVMKRLAELQNAPSNSSSSSSSMDLGQVYVAWLLMALQGARRLYENLYVSKPGKSPMWFVHWALGLVYYAGMSVAVWIEGSDAILESWNSSSSQGQQLLNRKTILPVALYVFACYKQNQCHRYLASLKKYTLPDEGMFRSITCPHYTCECLLYVAIARVAAPPNQLFNTSALLGLVFVAVNLGATAVGTNKWYAEKFGADKVAARWYMIPLVF